MAESGSLWLLLFWVDKAHGNNWFAQSIYCKFHQQNNFPQITQRRIFLVKRSSKRRKGVKSSEKAEKTLKAPWGHPGARPRGHQA